jgi:hypothetical protein
MEGGWIAPVSTLRYYVDNANTNGRTGEDDPVGRVTVLRRTEVLPSQRQEALKVNVSGEEIFADDRAVLDYVVRFSVDFLMLTGAGAVSPVPMTTAEWANDPRLVRGAILDVAVRTSQQEPGFTSDVPSAAFHLYKGLGAARIRRMRAEVLLPNVANRNR